MVKKWPMSPIGELLDFKNGLNKGKEYFGYGTPIVNYTDVYNNNGITKSDVKGKVHLTQDEIKRFEVMKNDVFFTRTSETPEEVGLSAVLLDDIDDCVFSGFVLRGRPKTNRLIGEYCKYCFSTKHVREKIIKNCTYTTRALTSGKVLSSIEIPVPDRTEQEEISKILFDIEEYIKDLDSLIEKKSGLRDGAISDLLSANTRIAGYKDDWKETTLGEEYVVTMGQSPDSNSYNSSRSGMPLVQGNADIENGVTSPKRYTSKPTKVCEVGDIIMTVRAPVGTVSKANQKVCLGRGVCAISGTHRDFIYYLMRYNEKFWESLGQGSTFTAVNSKEVKNFNIRIPNDTGEQDAIAKVLSDMDREIASLKEERDKMVQIREGAMDDLLTGRVRLTK